VIIAGKEWRSIADAKPHRLKRGIDVTNVNRFVQHGVREVLKKSRAVTGADPRKKGQTQCQKRGRTRRGIPHTEAVGRGKEKSPGKAGQTVRGRKSVKNWERRVTVDPRNTRGADVGKKKTRETLRDENKLSVKGGERNQIRQS